MPREIQMSEAQTQRKRRYWRVFSPPIEHEDSNIALTMNSLVKWRLNQIEMARGIEQG